ncbi:VOC family protein [Arthrobacter sp. NPDC090010]|uniref:VOC family protein n=1 Tax=Arthrobacter sp. NPDC090010 TaxID=3363942 RepID=UPI00380A44BE
MQITSVTFDTTDITRAEAFYGELLGLPVQRRDGELAIRIGGSRLLLREGPVGPGAQHLAFRIPRRQLGEAKAWISERTPLLRATDGSDEFEGPARWNARSVYFDDPDGNILEFIIHRDIPDDQDHPFSSEDILGISEVGIPVHDVSGGATQLESAFGLPRFGDDSATFLPVGTPGGLLILTKPGRAWFPTDRSNAIPSLDVEIRAEAIGSISPGPGITIRAAGQPKPRVGYFTR